MMGEEEVSVAVVNSGDNQNKNCLRFKLTSCGPQWIPEVTAKEPCAKKLAKRSLKIVKELENSFSRKELPEEVPYVEKCHEVSNSNISLEENSSCLQTTMTKFKLKRSGDKWFAEVTARALCAKKQAKEVSNPNSSPKENASCFRTTSSQKIEKTVSEDPSIHLNFFNSQYTEVIRKTDGPSSSYVQNEPLDQRSCMDALGGEEGMINKPRPYISRLVQKEKRNSLGCTKKRPRPYFSRLVQKEKRNNVGCTKKRRNNLHRLLFLPNGLQDGTELAYYVNGKGILKGYKQGNGIVCSHCDTEISPSEFEAHAKYSARRKPYNHICTTKGHSLHEIALRLSEGESIQSIMRSSDDKCAVCGVGGELFDCDGCPCAYHAVCLGLEGIPTGDWHCSRCTENIGPNGRDSSPVISQPDRVVKPPVYQPGGCVVCRAQDFSVDTFDELKIMQCYQCGRQYHVSCLLDNGLCDLKELSKDKWFCCSDCNSIHSTMQGLLKENKVLLAPVLEKHIGKGVTDGAVNSMHWQILSGISRSTDSRLLSKAAAIFKESFKTIRSKTCRDLIAAAVHGKNISDQESRQIYFVVLIVDSVVSSAGVLRIISREIAELPVVATSKKYRGKGYFKALFSCIEQLLVSINVKRIVLPAVKVAESMWTNKFGFKKISDEQLSEYTKDFQLTMFVETSMLEKVLPEANCKSKVGQIVNPKLDKLLQLADSSRTSVMEEVQQVAN